MKVHDLIEKEMPDIVPIIKKNAKKLGLHKINYDHVYLLHKTSAKVSSSRGYPDSFTVGTCFVRLVGNDTTVSIYISGLREWFRTSPILSCRKVKKGYKIETQNSFYFLEQEVKPHLAMGRSHV
jgi:hypothetical protein